MAVPIADALNATEKKAHRATEIQMEEFKAKEQELQGFENKLFDMRFQGHISQSDFDKQLARIRSNRSDLADQLETLQKGLTSAVMETAQTVLELATSAKSLWKSGSPQERRNFLDKLLSNPILDGANVRFTLKKPFAVLVDMKENVEWCARRDSNPQAVRHTPLKRTCIPIPPLARLVTVRIILEQTPSSSLEICSRFEQIQNFCLYVCMSVCRND